LCHYPNLSIKVTHKLALRSTRCIFLRYSIDHKGYRCLDLTTNNIIISRHIVFNEADFPFSASPYLTNDLDIFLQDDYPGALPIAAPLPVPHIPSGFAPLATAGGETACLGSSTMPGTEAGGHTTSLGSRTAPRIEDGGPTASPGRQNAPCIETSSSTATIGGLTARPCGAPLSPAPEQCPRLHCTPRGALDSTHTTRGSSFPALPLHYSWRP
jgi:hypothetical protein